MIDNARLYADTERRRRWHEITAEITQLMLGDFDSQQALQLIAARAREVSGSVVGAVLLRNDGELVVEAIDGPPVFAQYGWNPTSPTAPCWNYERPSSTTGGEPPDAGGTTRVGSLPPRSRRNGG